MAITDAVIVDRVRQFVSARDSDKTCCPSEIARDLAGEWRALMPRVRRVVDDMAVRGEIRVLQSGQPVDPSTARGPIRIGAAKHG